MAPRYDLPPGVVACGDGNWILASSIVKLSTPKGKPRPEDYADPITAWIATKYGDKVPCKVRPDIMLRRWRDALEFERAWQAGQRPQLVKDRRRRWTIPCKGCGEPSYRGQKGYCGGPLGCLEAPDATVDAIRA